jgi:hypothetical protein
LHKNKTQKKEIVMKKSMLVLLALVLALALAVPVFAARMEKVEYTEEYEFELIENCEDYGEGWNFSVWNRGTSTIIMTK